MNVDDNIDTNESSDPNTNTNDTAMKTDVENTSTNNISCPLFMDGLPSDFSTNPALAAIASLMNDEIPYDDSVPLSLRKSNVSTTTITRKEKQNIDITKRNNSIIAKHKRYSNNNKNRHLSKVQLSSQKKTMVDEENTAAAVPSVDDTISTDCSMKKSGTTTTTSIGEASLFLKMWKL